MTPPGNRGDTDRAIMAPTSSWAGTLRIHQRGESAEESDEPSRTEATQDLGISGRRVQGC